ncbi:hypothetical protein MPSEU_001050200 [Mayamaea pseudoterrestris]|nr:hypothetical protein MPSEU_001050200 [Mayamaea pseudoterrestris]
MSAGSQPSSANGSSSKASSGNYLFPAMKDKLQSSARDLMRSMEQMVGRNKPDNVKSLENTLRAVFSSCTSGADVNVTTHHEEEEYNEAGESSSPSKNFKRGPGMASRIPASETGEHIYAQLFFDDQVRAAKAVNALKEIDMASSAKKKNVTPVKSYYPSQQQQQLSKPFPASSPARQVQHSDFDIQPTNTFDDSISAISAHTLEAMARAGPTSGSPTFAIRDAAPVYQTRLPASTAVFVSSEHVLTKPYVPSVRVRSSGDYSGKSQSTKTTTTDSSSFDQWQREDKKYWVDQTKKDQLVKKHRRPSQGELSRHTRSTATTTASSGRSSHYHPHDATDYFFHKEPVALVETAPAVDQYRGRVVYDAVRNTGEI